MNGRTGLVGRNGVDSSRKEIKKVGVRVRRMPPICIEIVKEKI